jgi:hypothetical protein
MRDLTMVRYAPTNACCHPDVFADRSRSRTSLPPTAPCRAAGPDTGEQ